MAYSRWIQGDLYIYMDSSGMLCCAACSLMPIEEGAKVKMNQSVYFASTMDMIDHLGEHMDAGDYFPDDVIPALLEDDEENFPEEE
jgi:hypothetical protein